MLDRLRRRLFPHKDVSDPYTRWLAFANVGMQHAGNLYLFDHAVRNLPSDAPLVEIGSFMGLSANLITHYLRRHGKPNALFCADRWIDHKHKPTDRLHGSDVTAERYWAFIKESFCRNVRFWSGDRLPHAIDLFSDEFFAAWERGDRLDDVFGRPVALGGPISFAYVDGPHEYKPASRDFANVDRWLEPGGFVLFDDSYQAPGVIRLVGEIARAGRYELVARNPNHLFRKR